MPGQLRVLLLNELPCTLAQVLPLVSTAGTCEPTFPLSPSLAQSTEEAAGARKGREVGNRAPLVLLGQGHETWQLELLPHCRLHKLPWS